MGHFISVPSLVYRFIGIEIDSNSKDPIPDTGDHPRHYTIVLLCVCELTETVEEKRFY
jgi:hypothetical protein